MNFAVGLVNSPLTRVGACGAGKQIVGKYYSITDMSKQEQEAEQQLWAQQQATTAQCNKEFPSVAAPSDISIPSRSFTDDVWQEQQLTASLGPFGGSQINEPPALNCSGCTRPQHVRERVD
jgi:hypothetical protein